MAPFLELAGISKHFGSVRALDGVDLALQGADCLGLVGHNGAGKSTLIQLLVGRLRPTGGQVTVDGVPTSLRARPPGVRCVFQELSLCPNLDVAENTRILHRRLRGWGWRRAAAALIRASLDAIFPGHGIDPAAAVSDLSITQRQMVEIARAFTVTDEDIRLVILDEPTSSLDARTAAQMLAYVRQRVEEGLSVIFVSHMLNEVLANCDRIAVMKDGRVAAQGPVAAFDKDSLVVAMGTTKERGPRHGRTDLAADAAVRIRIAPAHQGDGQAVEARPGEIVGLAGLAGHGQTDLLLALYDQATARRTASVAFVAGDRGRDGVFGTWSIRENLTIRSLAAARRGPLLSLGRERRAADTWRRRFGIRTPDMEDAITTLSGGNQQKVLFARALASDATVILMDDPMRGVDVGTKREVYGLIEDEAKRGRTFIWYTTEVDELFECDRVYVFRDGAIAAQLGRDQLSEDRILQSSF